jgi:hypothetical protein
VRKVKVGKGKESEGGERVSRVKVEKESRKVKVEKGKEREGRQGGGKGSGGRVRRVKVDKGQGK